MISWFHRWRNNRHRQIFRVWDGARYRFVDPMVAWRCLKTHDSFEMERDIAGHDAGQEDSTQACLAATRAAFDVKPFDGSDGTPKGLTEDETLFLLFSFGEWMSVVKKNTRTQPTSSAASSPTEPPPQPSTGPGSSTAGSPSISDESSSDAPAA